MSTPSLGFFPHADSSEESDRSEAAGAPKELVVPTFEDVYETHFPFVWRSIRRLGVPASAVDDAVQDVFVVVHRRLPEFEARASVKTWLFAILIRVVRDYRRAYRRKDAVIHAHGAPSDPDDIEAAGDNPQELAAKKEAHRMLHQLLDGLEDEKREVFVLSELEQLAVPEIATALGINLNTAYSRLRVARQDFEQAVSRLRARDGWRQR